MLIENRVLAGSLFPKMSLLVDKFKPSGFEGLTLHEEVNHKLKQLTSASEDLPHLLIYGPRGSGKMTRIRIILQELFDKSTNKIKIEDKAFQTPSGKKIEVTIFSSNYHVELNPSDVGIYDRVVVQEIIKELAQNQQVDKSKKSYKVAVILEADRLSKEAQHALRRTMEKYSSNLRLILCANSTGRIINPIKSRCALLRIPGLNTDQMSKYLSRTCSHENIRISKELCQNIAIESHGNIRKALLLLEASSMSGSTEVLDWTTHVKKAADQIYKEQSPSSLLAVRSILYDLLSHCIPPSVILKSILFELLSRNHPFTTIEKLVECCARYESRLARGTKAIFHLEAFAANAMSILSKQ